MRPTTINLLKRPKRLIRIYKSQTVERGFEERKEERKEENKREKKVKMEKGCLSLTTSSSSSRPSIFFNNNGVFQSKQFKPSHHSSIPTTTTPTISKSTQITRRRRKPLTIKASNNDNFEASTRQTLASNWDVFNYSAPPTRLPRLDELDTGNMLQRQRIIFLGSQVLYLYTSNRLDI